MRKLLILIILLSALSVQGQTFPQRTAQGAIQAYYKAISQRDYVSAYNFLTPTVWQFQPFVSSFATTEYLVPYMGEFQQGEAPLSGYVPVVVFNYQPQNIIQTLAGCVFLTDRGPQPNALWYIEDMNLLPLSQDTYTPIASDIRNLLNIDCSVQFAPEAITAVEQDEATRFLHEYFTAINQQTYQAAHALWLFPLPGQQPNGAPATDFRTPLDQFASGYFDTYHITLYTGTYQFGGATAGRSYLEGFMPVVLVGQEFGGQITSFSGCYALGRFIDGRMGIVNGQLAVLQDGVPLGQTVVDTLANLDCAALGMSF